MVSLPSSQGKVASQLTRSPSHQIFIGAKELRAADRSHVWGAAPAKVVFWVVAPAKSLAYCGKVACGGKVEDEGTKGKEPKRVESREREKLSG